MILSRRIIFLTTALLSLVLSAWSVYSDDVINNDGIVYLHSARYFASGDWSTGFALYSWPFFPLLIAFFSQLAGLELELAAHVLNALFSVLMALAFVALADAFGGDRKTLLIAGLVILLHPYLLESRADIVRDHGFWAFYLLSILWFFRFYQTPGTGLALAWCLAMVIAALFRIEGLVFLLCLPITLLFRSATPMGSRCRYFFQAHLLTAIMILGMLGGIVSVSNFDQLQAGRLHDFIVRFDDLAAALNTGLAEKTQQLRDSVLNVWSQRYASHALFGVITAILLTVFVKVLSPVYLVLLLLPSLRGRFRPAAGARLILTWLGLLNLIVILGFFLPLFFISGRHMVALALILMIPIPFILASIHDYWQVRALRVKYKWLYAALLPALLYMAADGLFSTHGSTKNYIREAGVWLHEHVPDDARLYTNNRKLHYYSKRWMRGEAPSQEVTVDEHSLQALKKEQSYDYLALQIDRSSPLRGRVSDLLQLQPVIVFESERQDIVLIYLLRNQ